MSRHRANPPIATRFCAACVVSAFAMLAAPPLAAAEAATAATTDVYRRPLGRATLRLMDLSLGMLAAAGWSSADPATVAALQGGGHDPQRVGFTIQNVELSAAGAVDPYLRAEAHVILQIDAAGESIVELEEAFAATTSLPWGLELKGGQFFTEFGRQNPQHPHTWHFADQPVALSRILGGDGLRGPGLRLSWLAPLPWYCELISGVQNANGETAVSFLAGSDADPIAGYAHTGRMSSSWRDMLYSGRWLQSLALSDTVTLNVGVSGLRGPNDSGPANRTHVAGADTYLHWRRRSAVRGWPFVIWQTEALRRWFAAGDVVTTTVRDDGFYSQVVYGFVPRWAAGVRVDVADGRGGSLDAAHDRRRRAAAQVSFYPSEFAKLRLQLNGDDSETLGRALSAWLQGEVNLGAHGAHTF